MKLFGTIFPAAIFVACLAPGAQAADKDMKSMMEQGHQRMMSMPA